MLFKRGCSLSHPRVTPFVLPERSLDGMCAALVVVNLPALILGDSMAKACLWNIFPVVGYSQADTRPP